MKYFVSYSWKNKRDADLGFGNAFVETETPISNQEDIMGIEKQIESLVLKRFPQQVIIINFIRIDS